MDVVDGYRRWGLCRQVIACVAQEPWALLGAGVGMTVGEKEKELT